MTTSSKFNIWTSQSHYWCIHLSVLSQLQKPKVLVGTYVFVSCVCVYWKIFWRYEILYLYYNIISRVRNSLNVTTITEGRSTWTLTDCWSYRIQKGGRWKWKKAAPSMTEAINLWWMYISTTGNIRERSVPVKYQRDGKDVIFHVGGKNWTPSHFEIIIQTTAEDSYYAFFKTQSDRRRQPQSYTVHHKIK